LGLGFLFITNHNQDFLFFFFLIALEKDVGFVRLTRERRKGNDMVSKKVQEEQKRAAMKEKNKIADITAPEELAERHQPPEHSLHLNRNKDTVFLKVTLHKIPPQFIVFEATETHVLVHTLKFIRKLFL